MARLWMLVGSSPTRHLFETPGLSRADRVGPEIGAGQARTVWWAASDTPTPEPTNLRAVGKPAGRRSVSPTPADFAWRAEFQKVRILRLEVPSRFLERRSGQQLLGKQRLAGWWKFRHNPTRRCQAASQPAAKGGLQADVFQREREAHTHTLGACPWTHWSACKGPGRRGSTPTLGRLCRRRRMVAASPHLYTITTASNSNPSSRCFTAMTAF